MRTKKFNKHIYHRVGVEETKKEAQQRCQALRRRNYLARYTKVKMQVGYAYDIWRASRV